MKIGDILLVRFAVSIVVVYAIALMIVVGVALGLDAESWVPGWVSFVVGFLVGTAAFRLGLPLLRPWYTEAASPPPMQWTEDKL